MIPCFKNIKEHISSNEVSDSVTCRNPKVTVSQLRVHLLALSVPLSANRAGSELVASAFHVKAPFQFEDFGARLRAILCDTCQCLPALTEALPWQQRACETDRFQNELFEAHQRRALRESFIFCMTAHLLPRTVSLLVLPSQKALLVAGQEVDLEVEKGTETTPDL